MPNKEADNAAYSFATAQLDMRARDHMVFGFGGTIKEPTAKDFHQAICTRLSVHE